MKIFIKDIFLYIIITFAILTIVSCNEKKLFDGYLYPIRENGLYGYIDSVGNRIIEPEFLWVSTFHNGLAMAVVDTIYRVVPDSMAYEVGERDTIINVYRMYAKYGYIDKSGDFVIEPKFISYVDMSEIGDVANDMDDCSNALYRNSFRNKRALFYDTLTWKNGYIDTKGSIVIPSNYYYSDPFSEGIAVVRDAVAEPLYTNNACIYPSRLRCAYLDTLGNVVTDFKYESLTRFCSGRGIGKYKKIKKNTVNIEDTTIVYETYSTPQILINKEGKEIKELDFNYDYYGFSRSGISVASDGFFMRSFIGKENISYYYIDVNGNFLEPLKGLSDYQLDSLGRCNDIMQVLPDDANIATATYFNEGFSGISPDKKHWFVIDKYLLIHGYGEESIFDGFRPFNNGLAAVKKNGKWGFINRKIKEQIPCKYDSCGFAYPYLEEVFEYDIQGEVKRKAYINRKDSLIWESPIYKSEKIDNRYSITDSKDWGKWTYEYNPIKKYLIYLIIGAVVALIVTIAVSWRFASNRSSKVENPEVLTLQKGPVSDEAADGVLSNTNENESNEILSWPTVGQYTEVIKASTKSPDEYFDKLKHLRPVLDSNGEPIMSSGNFAVVFKMKDAYGKQYAVRCFHRAQLGREKNYNMICDELAKVSSPYLSPIRYYDKELFVDSGEYPVLLMDWVDGMTLDKYIRKVINDKKALNQLATKFKDLAIWLLNQPFAHGDLKPDNILVKDDGSLVLVDYDGMFVPAMQGQKAREIGSPDFRNPSRTENDFDKDIDTLPIISILLSLELLLENKDYLSQFGAEDRLLFSANDYSNLEDSTIYKKALTSNNSFISKLAIIMRKSLKGLYNTYNLICFLDLKNKPSNDAYEKTTMFVILISFIGISYISLVLRSYFGWDILFVSMAIISCLIIVLSVCVIIDIFRPNQEEHLAILSEENIGCFAYIGILPLLMMGDFFSNWINGLDLSYISEQPFYNDKWYITALIWVESYAIGALSLNMPNILLHLRMRYYLTPEEETIKAEQEEIIRIRKQLRDAEEKKKRNGFRYYHLYDDMPFDDYDYLDRYDYY